MLSNDSHPGIFTFLLGLILVTLAGVGLSMLVDHRFSFSKMTSGLESEIRVAETELNHLQASHQATGGRLAALLSTRQKMAREHASIRDELRNLDQRRTTLEKSRQDSHASLQATEEEFGRYRADHRAAVWAAAAGLALEKLVTRDGRTYRQVVIARVTAVGLEIRHAEGTSRVQAPNLDPAMQARFLWNDEERRTQLKQESARAQTAFGAPEAGRDISNTPPPAGAGPVAGKLETLRHQVNAWQVRVTQLTAERDEARFAGSSRLRNAVPGTLETWQARTARLATELSQARAQLAAAKAVMSTLAPRDPILEPAADGR